MRPVESLYLLNIFDEVTSHVELKKALGPGRMAGAMLILDYFTFFDQMDENPEADAIDQGRETVQSLLDMNSPQESGIGLIIVLSDRIVFALRT